MPLHLCTSVPPVNRYSAMFRDEPYVLLIASLPYLTSLFAPKQPPLSRRQLDRRLRLLSDEDAETLRRIEALIAWDQLPLGRTDEDLVAEVDSCLASLTEPTLRSIVLHRFELRTVLAALRRRHRGAGAPSAGSVWGVGRWTEMIRRNWSDGDFGLGRVYPWLPEARHLLEQDETVALERLLMTQVWADLDRQGLTHAFDLPAVVLYVLRWHLVVRWSRTDAAPAMERFDALLDQGFDDSMLPFAA